MYTHTYVCVCNITEDTCVIVHSKTMNPLQTAVYILLLQCFLNYTAMVYKYNILASSPPSSSSDNDLFKDS